MKKSSVISGQWAENVIAMCLLLLTAHCLLLTPTYAFDIAAPSTVPQPVSTVAEADTATQNVFNTVVYLFFTIGSLGALLYTVWGAVDWITAGGDKDKIGAARKKITQSLVGLAALAFSFFIVFMVGKFVGIDLVNLPPLKPLGNFK